DGSMIELHWRLGQRWFPTTILLHEAWPRLEERMLLGVRTAWPAAEDLFLFHVADGLKAGGVSIRWLADLASILGSHPALDWDRVRGVAQRNGALACCRVALAALA